MGNRVAVRSASGALVVGLFGAASVSTGCSNVAYEPRTPREVRTRGVGAAVTRVEFNYRARPSEAKIDVDARASTPSSLVHAAATGTATELCRTGVAIRSFSLRDTQNAQDPPVPLTGSTKLRLTFPLQALTESTNIDLATKDSSGDACVRLPLTGPDPALAWEIKRDWSIGLAGRFDVSFGYVANVTPFVDASLSFGRWWGPVLVSAELGYGAGFCREGGVCAGPTGTPTGVTVVPMALRGEWFFLDGQGPTGAIGLRYVARAAFLPASEKRWLHGAQVTFRYGFAATSPVPGHHVYGGRRLMFFGGEVLIGFVRDLEGRDSRTVPSFGAGLTMNWGL